MNLKDFVRETLLEIAEGLTEAQRNSRRGGAVFNPRLKAIEPGKREIETIQLKGTGLIATAAIGEVAVLVDFDVAITVEEDSKSETGKKEGGEVGAKLHIFSAGIDTNTTTGVTNRKAHNEVSRVRFQVPVSLPPA